MTHNIRRALVALIAVLLLQVPLLAVTDPTLPSTTITTTVASTPVTGMTRNVGAGGDVQAAIDAAALGDEIVLAAGATFTGPIILKNKVSGSGWITIRTNTTIPTEGTRVTPTTAASYATITAPGSGESALKTEATAHHYRIMGIAFQKASPSVFTYGLVTIGNNEAQTTSGSVPHHIILDRLYIHGDATSDLKYGVSGNGNTVALVDSYIKDIHVVGQDSQAFVATNATGPFKLHNNYLEASTENVLFGGDDPKLAGAVLQDITITHNHIAKNPAWYDSTYAFATTPHWAVKNILELKNTQRVLIDSNILEYSWVDGQQGFAVLFTPRNQYGTCSQCIVADVTMTDNIIRHATAAMAILGHDDEQTSQQTARIKISNNLWDDISSTWGREGTGWWAFINGGTNQAGPTDLQLIHNTAFSNGTPVYLVPYYNNTYSTKPNLVIKDNVFAHNTYGVFGDNTGTGNATLTTYATPGGVFTKNILMGGDSANYTSWTGNYFPASWTGVLVNQAGGDYHIVSASMYHNAASDGTDLGANIDTIATATETVISGGASSDPPPPSPPPAPSSPSPAVGATSVSTGPTLTWTGAGTGITFSVALGTSNPPSIITSGLTTGTYTPATLTAATTYYWRVTATSSGGSTAGSIWSFTTAVPAPAPPAPSNPFPASGATSISTAPTLTWTGSSNVTYTVAFGLTNPPNQVVSGRLLASYTPGTIGAGLTYYWRITSVGASGSTSSPVWSFTTLAAPAPVTGDLTITAFTVSYSTTTRTALAWTVVSQSSNIVSVEVWRAPYTVSCSATVRTRCAWKLRKTIAAPASTTTWSGSTTDNVARSVSYWYGLHALNAAGTVAYEPGAAGVRLGPTSNCPTRISCTTQ